MTHRHRTRDRRTIRLAGYDYTQAGEYFITACTHGRQCILGAVSDLRFYPSDIGNIVKRCWDAIPEHFPNARGGMIQIMPNHLHGIITIRPRTNHVGAGHVQPLHERTKQHLPQFQRIAPGSLGSVIRSLKAAVTKESREKSLVSDGPLWQRNFYDHIIRDDISQFYVERYIEVNPLLWRLDVENPGIAGDETNLDAIRNALRDELHFDPASIEYITRNEIEYRAWRSANA